MPKYGFVLPTIKSIKRRKAAKRTLVVCANATCCHKIPLKLIGKYNRPACFANQTDPLKYAAQKCVWMEIPAFCNWFNEVFYPVVRRTCHPVLLLVDNDISKGECCGTFFFTYVTS